VAAAPVNGSATADAVVIAGRASDAQGPNLGHKRHLRVRPEPFDGISMTCSVAGDRYSWYAANKTKQFQWQHPWWYPQVVEMTANASGQTLR
jgi:hypothetical protein